MITWEQIYNLLGIRDFIYFIDSPSIQDFLFPVKIVFILFALFFLVAVIYFMYVSSWVRIHFLEDVSEFFAWQAFGLKQIADKWKKIYKRLDSGLESEYKLAVIEGDDFLAEILDDSGYEGKTFEEILASAGRSAVPNQEEVIEAHKVRNSIVYEPDYNLTLDQTTKVLSIFETTVKNIGTS